MYVPTRIGSTFVYFYTLVRMRKRDLRYSVFVCVCVCVDCYSCSRINEVQVRVSIGFYSRVFNLWIWKIILGSRIMPSFAHLECHCILFRRVRKKTCPWSVAYST